MQTNKKYYKKTHSHIRRAAKQTLLLLTFASATANASDDIVINGRHYSVQNDTNAEGLFPTVIPYQGQRLGQSEYLTEEGLFPTVIPYQGQSLGQPEYLTDSFFANARTVQPVVHSYNMSAYGPYGPYGQYNLPAYGQYNLSAVHQDNLPKDYSDQSSDEDLLGQNGCQNMWITEDRDLWPEGQNPSQEEDQG
ncbi:MAG: hypothetical protein LBR89_01910 [Holosporales bacterium]|jgi:hypothetical protein|nr:hypothetical protein [Holosporales bacterium]